MDTKVDVVDLTGAEETVLGGVAVNSDKEILIVEGVEVLGVVTMVTKNLITMIAMVEIVLEIVGVEKVLEIAVVEIVLEIAVVEKVLEIVGVKIVLEIVGEEIVLEIVGVVEVVEVFRITTVSVESDKSRTIDQIIK